MNRRQFVGSTTALIASGCVRANTGNSPVSVSASAKGAEGRLPIGFSTLGSPKWGWIQTLDFAAAHNFHAVELRGLQEALDLSKRPEFQRDRIGQTKRELTDRGLVVSCLGASIAMHEQDSDKLATAMSEARRFVDIASGLGAPYVRVFGDKFVTGVSRDALLAHVGRGLRLLGDYARERGVTVLLESHGEFVDSPTLLEIMQRADSPSVALLWDAHHTFVARESPETTVRQLGRYIRHTHLKDSVPDGTGRKYLLTGAGDVPVRRQVEALVRIGYTGLFSFEWEKRWHPEIEEPEVAIAHYATTVSGYLRDAGVKGAATR